MSNYASQLVQARFIGTFISRKLWVNGRDQIFPRLFERGLLLCLILGICFVDIKITTSWLVFFLLLLLGFLELGYWGSFHGHGRVMLSVLFLFVSDLLSFSGSLHILLVLAYV